ncbi:MAG: alpha/beta hydrolase [Acidobacteria bacterium]|nr:alpha/beta hydrolase [Acidobacteriota bacterium]
MPKVALPEVELYYEQVGSGPPIVLVHEFSGSCRSWSRQVEAFRKQYSVLVYNCRGYPPSGVPEDPSQYSQEHSVRDLLALLDHLKIGRAHVGGLSMGGAIALSFALEHPERVRALVLAGTGTGSDNREQMVREYSPIADRLESDGPRAVFDGYYPRMATRIPLLRKSAATWQEFAEEFASLSGRGLARTLRGVQFKRPTIYALEARMKELRVPTMILVGDEDGPALEPSRFMSRVLPNARLVIFPGTGHTLNLEEPEKFNEAVLRFLERVEANSELG